MTYEEWIWENAGIRDLGIRDLGIGGLDAWIPEPGKGIKIGLNRLGRTQQEQLAIENAKEAMMSPEKALKIISKGNPVTAVSKSGCRSGFKLGHFRPARACVDTTGVYISYDDADGQKGWMRFLDVSGPEEAISYLVTWGNTFSMKHPDDWWHEAKEVETLQTIKAAPKVAGYSCKRCNEFCEFSEPNQADGSFICFKCR